MDSRLCLAQQAAERSLVTSYSCAREPSADMVPCGADRYKAVTSHLFALLGYSGSLCILFTGQMRGPSAREDS